MKKLLALTLAVILALSMGVMAFAASSDNEREDVTLTGTPAGDTYAGIAVPGKNVKLNVQIKEAGATATEVAKLKTAHEKALADLEADFSATSQVHDWGTTTTLTDAQRDTDDDCDLCKAVYAAYDKWQEAVDTNANGVLILDPVTAWKAYDTDKSFKIGFKVTKGNEYVKGYEIKKNTAGEMFVQVNFNELYLAGMKDVAWEITLTVTNADKFNKKLLVKPSGGEFKRSQYIKYEIANYRYGFNGVNLAIYNSTTKKYDMDYRYKDYEIKDSTPSDFDVPANLDSGSGTAASTSAHSAIHFKKGTGETYSFDYGNGDAYFEVKMDNQAVVNLYMSTATVKSLLNAYPDAELKFWDWKGKPELDFTATVELSYDEDDMGDSPYLYKWDGSVLTEVTSAEFEDETCTFKTRSLGAYVMSDIELDASVVAPSTTAADPADATEAPADGDETVTKVPIPDTGASDFVGLAVAMAMVSLAAAGAVALKK